MRKHSLGILFRILVYSSLINTGFAFAQDLAAVAGKVTDSKGNPIPGASVVASKDSANKIEILTDLDGTFKFEALPAGTYQLAVEIGGFLKASRSAVDTSAESSRSLAIQLEPVPPPARPKNLPATAKQQQQQTGQQQQAEGLSAPTFQNATVTDLPGLNQFQQDLTQETGSATGIASRQESLFLVSGNSANLDAGSLSDPGFRGQIMDAARQMGFLIQDFGPGGQEGQGGMGGFGGGPGGGGPGGGGPRGGGGPGGGMGFAGMAGRGGRGASFKQPKIEGNADETYSNSALNARSYSLTGKTLPKPVNIQNNFSVTVGGVLPFFKTKSQTTSRSRSGGFGPVSQPGWSFTYSGNRNRSAQDVLATVPTDLERTGDFSQTYTQALSIDPATGAHTIINQPVRLFLNPNDPSSQFTRISSIDAVANGLLQFIPRANLACAANAPCVNNYSLERSLPTSSDQIQASITGLRITSKDNLGVNYSWRRGSSLNAAIFPGLDTHRTNSGQNIGISGMHTFKPRLIANWRLSLNRTRTESTNSFSYHRNVLGELGITEGLSQDPINWGPPTISFTGYGGLSLAAPSTNKNQTFQISGGLNKIGSKHSIRAGIDASWAQRNSQSDSNGRGTYTFTGYATALLDAQGRQVSGTGNDFTDFLLGYPYSTSRRYVNPNYTPYEGNTIYLRNRSYSLYIMDDWRFRSTLTFNYGLRYEYLGPSYEIYNRLVSLDANPGFTELKQVFPNERGPLSGHYFPRSLVNPDRNNVAPRIGIAWRPTLKSPFVIRAGYGIGYNAGGFSSIVGQLMNQAPFAVIQNLTSTQSNRLLLSHGFPENSAVTTTNTYAIDPHYKASYAQQWNLSVQTQLSRLYVLTVAYDGSKGTGLDIMRAPNRSPSAGQFIYQTNGASSIYHGLNVQFSRRFSHGFNTMSSYTFSKSIDDSSGGGGSMVAQNDANLAAERSLSSQDRRHNFQTNLVYELPIGQNRMFFAGASTKLLNIISGWTFNGSISLASGAPLTARYASGNGNASGAALYNSLRPDGTGISPVLSRSQRTTMRYFNTAAFAPPAGPYGTAGRNTIIGPGTNMVNLSVRKSFRLDENNRRLDFSWQVQNLLNHPNWSGVGTTINSLNYGQVTSVRAMRSMTMDLRIRF